MNNKEIEKIDSLLRKFWTRRLKVSSFSLAGSKCAPEAILEDYINQTLSGAEIKKLESHLNACQTCAARLLILKSMKFEEEINIPEKLIYKAKDLVPDTRPNCLELVLSFAKNTINIIRHSGMLLSPEPVLEPSRGGADPETKKTVDCVAVKKLFEDISVDVQIERINGSYKLMVNCVDINTELSPQNMRLVLSSMDRELSSVDDSEAVFYIKLKRYLIKIIQSDYEVGDIRIDLRKEDEY